MAWLSHFWDRPWNRFLNQVCPVWHGGLRLQPSAAQGLELAVENRGQTLADQDWLRDVAQTDLHPAIGELFDSLHPGQVNNGAAVNPDELLARKL